MKSNVFILLFSFVTAILQAQNVRFDLVKQMGGIEYDFANSIARDNFGNLYTTGVFRATADFDPGVGVFNLSSFGRNDIFISKLDGVGNFIWAKQMGGVSEDDARSIDTDAYGNLYITGVFSGTTDFDPGPAVFNLSSFGDYDIFVAKLDANGNFIWAKQMGGAGPEADFGWSITVDAAGNAYTTGRFSETADFDPGVGVFNLTSFGWYDIFVSKLDAAGNFIWAKQMGGVDQDDASSIVIDSSGNLCIAGGFTNTADFDPGVGVFNLTSFGWFDSFICKLDSAGNFIWAKQMGADIVLGFSIAVDSPGNLYTTGFFYGTADFDPGVGVFNLSSFGFTYTDIFVLKLDTDGNFIWAKQMGGTETDEGRSIAIDASGNVYTTGLFEGIADFEPGACEFNLNSAGSYDIFVSKLDADGNFVWAKQMGGTEIDAGTSIALDASDNVYTTGLFQSITDFDPAIAVYNLTSFGYADIFIHKMSPCTNNTTSTITVSSCRPYTINCQTYPSSGVYTIKLVNSLGCDSIVTLNLTITNASTTSTTTVEACNSYTWHGQTYAMSGIYTDTLIDASGCPSLVLLRLTIKPISYTSISQSICQGQNFEGHTSTGVYIDTLVAANGCDSVRTLQLTVKSKPVPDLGEDKNICFGDSLVLNPGQFNNYLWHDGSSQNYFIARQAGLYSVVVTNNCDTSRDEVLIKEGICDLWFPSAFTPNNDGKNDLFKPAGNSNLKEFQLSVYNRWGQKYLKRMIIQKDGRVILKENCRTLAFTFGIAGLLNRIIPESKY